MPQRFTRDEFLALWGQAGHCFERMQQMTRLHRWNIEKRLERLGEAPAPDASVYPDTLPLHVRDGVVVIGGDAHFWPGESLTPAYEAFLAVVQAEKPMAVILNGDVLDGARISRHDPIGWQKQPTLHEELAEVQARMREIERAAPRDCELHRTIGNHDMRFDGRLARDNPDFADIAGTRLRDHLPEWSESWRVDINRSELAVMHSWHGGIHATWNNILKGGQSIATNHLHVCKVEVHTTLHKRLYGIDTGMLSNPGGPQFRYRQGRPARWASGFAVCTFADGRLMPPELCEVLDGRAWFRGRAIAGRVPSKPKAKRAKR